MPRSMTLTCYLCNEPMWAGSTSKPQGEAAHNKCRKEIAKTCSDCGKPASNRGTRCNPCRYLHAQATAKAACAECDKPAIASKLCVTHYSYRFRANHGRKDKRHSKDCAFCGNNFTTTTSSTAYCSLVCAQRHRAGWSAGKELARQTKLRVWHGHVLPPRTGNALIAGQCAYCPSYFVGPPNARYCSDKCSTNAAWKRRYDRRGEFKVTDKLRLAIYERDNHTCQLCHEPVDLTLHYQDMMAATLDHIIPQSHMLVPDHSEGNLRLAHRRCNSARGDRLELAA